jgi:1,4-alpha-glucan branching enzyme
MPASQLNIAPSTPLGANLAPGGVTFRTWAPAALQVYIALKQPTGTAAAAFPKLPADLLVKDANGFWAGFVPGLKDGDRYRFLCRRNRERRLQARSLCAGTRIRRVSGLQLHRPRSRRLSLA